MQTKSFSDAKLRKAFTRLARMFAVTFSDIDGCLVIDGDEARRHRESFINDDTGLEAFVNHVHLEDVVEQMLRPRGAGRRVLMSIGEDLIKVWSERLLPILNGREVLFYLGGKDTVAIRFHVVRQGQPTWVRLDDTAFMEKEGTSVWRLTSTGLRSIAA